MHLMSELSLDYAHRVKLTTDIFLFTLFSKTGNPCLLPLLSVRLNDCERLHFFPILKYMFLAFTTFVQFVFDIVNCILKL